MTYRNPHAVAIGRAVHLAAVDAGLKLNAVADASGMTRSTFSRRVNGALPFTWPELAAVAEALGVSIVDLAASADHLSRKSAA